MFYVAREWALKKLFPGVTRIKKLELVAAVQDAENDVIRTHIKDLEARYQRLVVDSVPPNVVTTDSLVLIEIRARLTQLEKTIGRQND